MAIKELVLIGERDLAKRAHAGIEASLETCLRDGSTQLRHRWLRSDEVDPERPAEQLRGVAGVWCTPGSPYASTAGALAAIRFAREEGVAFLGTCGGFQHALMEFYRNVLGRMAYHEETDGSLEGALIVKLSCSLAGARAAVAVAPGSGFESVLGALRSTEEFNCNYGVASDLIGAFSGSALRFVAHDESGQVRAFRLDGHRFFVGTLFQPERKALVGDVHPLVRSFLGAVGG